MFCNNCGKKIKAGSDICPYCQADNTFPSVHSHFEIPEEVRQAKENEALNRQQDEQQNAAAKTDYGKLSETVSAFNPEEERRKRDEIQKEKQKKRRKILTWTVLAAVVFIAAAGTFRFLDRDPGMPSNEQIIEDLESVIAENEYEYPDEGSIKVNSTGGIHPTADVEVTTDIPGADVTEKELTIITNTYTLSYEKEGNHWERKSGPEKEEDKIQKAVSVKENNALEDVKEWAELQQDAETFLKSNNTYKRQLDHRRRDSGSKVVIDDKNNIEFKFIPSDCTGTYKFNYEEDKGLAYYASSIQITYTWNQDTGEWESKVQKMEPSTTQYFLDEELYASKDSQYIFYIEKIDDKTIKFTFAADGEEVISSSQQRFDKEKEGDTVRLTVKLGKYGNIYIYPENTLKNAVWYTADTSEEMMTYKDKNNVTYEQLLKAYDSAKSGAGSTGDASTSSEAEESSAGSSTGNIDTSDKPYDNDDLHDSPSSGNDRKPDSDEYGSLSVPDNDRRDR